MVEWKEIGEICKPITPPKKIPTKDYLNSGQFPVIDQGQNMVIAFTNDASTLVSNDEYVLFGDHTRYVKYFNGSFAQGADGLKILKVKHGIIPRYFYFAFQNTEVPTRGYSRHWSIAKALQIPIPSLAEQERIVGILDTFTASIDNLKGQIAQRRKQFEFYRDQLLDLEVKPGVEMIALKEVADIGTGSSNTNEGLEEGKYPFYTRGKEVLWKNEYEYDETSIITAGDGVGVGKVFHFVSGKFALHQRAYRIHIKTEEINPRFIYYYMVSTFETYIKMKSFFAAVTSVRKPMIFNYPIPKCSLSEQHRIVSILDTFEESISNLEAQLEQRQKQYEYYRNQLLTFA